MLVVFHEYRLNVQGLQGKEGSICTCLPHHSPSQPKQHQRNFLLQNFNILPSFILRLFIYLWEAEVLHILSNFKKAIASLTPPIKRVTTSTFMPHKIKTPS